MVCAKKNNGPTEKPKKKVKRVFRKIAITRLKQDCHYCRIDCAYKTVRLYRVEKKTVQKLRRFLINEKKTNVKLYHKPMYTREEEKKIATRSHSSTLGVLIIAASERLTQNATEYHGQ